MKILFIDDDKAPIQYYLQLLRSNGCEVTHCRNPDDALRELNAPDQSFALILLDSAMPPGEVYADRPTEEGLTTGAQLFKDVRKRCPEVPIFILTNFGGLDWIKAACETPGVQEIQKMKTTPLELLKKVRHAVGGH